MVRYNTQYTTKLEFGSGTATFYCSYYPKKYEIKISVSSNDGNVISVFTEDVEPVLKFFVRYLRTYYKISNQGSFILKSCPDRGNCICGNQVTTFTTN